ncbi:hypothetical protein [Actinophytocola sp.]|nr:hypothetical protein [Actinophytocola sp.]HET9144082.1 hypothetical protein [Actinophytocola sp.]
MINTACPAALPRVSEEELDAADKIIDELHKKHGDVFDFRG